MRHVQSLPDCVFQIGSCFLQIANALFNFSFGLLLQPFGLLLFAANQFADFFLDFAHEVFGRALDLIFIDHDEILDVTSTACRS